MKTYKRWVQFAATLFLLFNINLLSAQSSDGKLLISHLTGDFYIFTTYQSFNGNEVPANGMYVLSDKGALMFDTPWDTTQLQPLLDSIRFRHHAEVVFCIATHSHEDRTGGFDFFNNKGIATYSTLQTDQICQKHNGKRARFVIKNDTVFSFGNHSFQTFYPGQGHTADNIVVWFDKEKILYGGCFVKSVQATDLGYVGEANLTEWPSSIKRVQKKFKNPAFIIPGHQDWLSRQSLKHTLNLLKLNGLVPASK